MALQKDSKNTIGRAYWEQVSFKTNSYKTDNWAKNQKEKVGFSGTHNEEIEPGEYDTHKYATQKETSSNLTNEFV